MHGRKIDGEECLRPSELPMAVVQKKLFVPKINFGLEDIVFLLNSRSSDWILSLREFPLSVSHCLWARRSPICKDIEESLLFCANCDEIGCERRVSKNFIAGFANFERWDWLSMTRYCYNSCLATRWVSKSMQLACFHDILQLDSYLLHFSCESWKFLRDCQLVEISWFYHACMYRTCPFARW